jgi:tRNA pseudouridine55 synthase
MTGHDKRYEGLITLGEATDTDDAEGAVTATLPVPPIGPGRLRTLEAAFTGEIQQRPPAYSAIKTGGERAYAIARRGGDVDLPARPVTVYAMRLDQQDTTHLAITVHCGPGTYIRSLARDIGATLGCGAHLSALRRTSAGGFALDDAVTLGELEQATGAGTLEDLLFPADEGLLGTEAAILSAGNAHSLTLGQTVSTGAPERALLRVYDTAGEFVATGAIDGAGVLKPLKVFRAG